MNTYRVTKLDKRYSGHTRFEYLVEPKSRDVYQSRQQINDWRDWCWATFGAGMERDWACAMLHINKISDAIWAWDTEHGNKRLYLKSTAELVLFQLKW